VRCQVLPRKNRLNREPPVRARGRSIRTRSGPTIRRQKATVTSDRSEPRYWKRISLGRKIRIKMKARANKTHSTFARAILRRRRRSLMGRNAKPVCVRRHGREGCGCAGPHVWRSSICLFACRQHHVLAPLALQNRRPLPQREPGKDVSPAGYPCSRSRRSSCWYRLRIRLQPWLMRG
jgi:hypothetical protein